MKKALIALFVLLILGGGGAAYYFFIMKKDPTPPEKVEEPVAETIELPISELKPVMELQPT